MCRACQDEAGKVRGRDPRIHPRVGDVVGDRLGKLRVAGINEYRGVDNVTWERIPCGMLSGYKLHTSLTHWREKVETATVIKAMN